jgi:hypothetical protein
VREKWGVSGEKAVKKGLISRACYHIKLFAPAGVVEKTNDKSILNEYGKGG